MATLELGDLSDEIILKVLGFLDIKNLLRVGHVSNRLRSDISINLTVANCASRLLRAIFSEILLNSNVSSSHVNES